MRHGSVAGRVAEGVAKVLVEALPEVVEASFPTVIELHRLHIRGYNHTVDLGG
jgi:hypothetical protein